MELLEVAQWTQQGETVCREIPGDVVHDEVAQVAHLPYMGEELDQVRPEAEPAPVMKPHLSDGLQLQHSQDLDQAAQWHLVDDQGPTAEAQTAMALLNSLQYVGGEPRQVEEAEQTAEEKVCVDFHRFSVMRRLFFGTGCQRVCLRLFQHVCDDKGGRSRLRALLPVGVLKVMGKIQHLQLRSPAGNENSRDWDFQASTAELGGDQQQ